MVWWSLYWDHREFRAERTGCRDRTVAVTLGEEGGITYAFTRKQFPKRYKPTIHDLNEALAPYNVQFPVPEEPQWWYRGDANEWGESRVQGALWGTVFARIYGTSENREERYQQLAAAVKAVEETWT